MKARFLPTGASNFSLLFTSLFLKKRGRDATLRAQDVRATPLTHYCFYRRRSKPPPPLVEAADPSNDSHGGFVE